MRMGGRGGRDGDKDNTTTTTTAAAAATTAGGGRGERAAGDIGSWGMGRRR